MKNTIKKLEELKENLFELSHEKQYDKIINILNDIDNQTALDYVYYDSDIITSYDAEERAESELKNRGLDGLRCYIGDTYADDIYRISGYGNLENITDDDIENLIDEVIQILKDEEENGDENDKNIHEQKPTQL